MNQKKSRNRPKIPKKSVRGRKDSETNSRRSSGKREESIGKDLQARQGSLRVLYYMIVHNGLT